MAAYNLTLLNRGEPQQRVFFDFARAVAGAVGSSPQPGSQIDLDYDVGAEPGKLTVADLAVGDTLKAKSFLESDAKFECVAASTTTSSSSTNTTTTTSGTALVTPGLDGRANVVSVVPKASPNNTQIIVLGFLLPWGTVPPSDLFSFFVLAEVAVGDCVTTNGYEIHAGTVRALGPQPMFLLDYGAFGIDTECPILLGQPINININAGSQPDASTAATFDQSALSIGLDEIPAMGTLDPQGLLIFVNAQIVDDDS